MLPIYQQILGLKIAVDNIKFMNIRDATDNMLEEFTSLLFLQFGLFNNIVK